ncbi:MAG: hypothetical protein ABI867_24340 [Kofleriaceae bacterium]
MAHDLFAHLAGPALDELATGAASWPWFAGEPESLTIDDRKRKVTPEWRPQLVAAKRQGSAYWNATKLVTLLQRLPVRNGIVLAAAPRAFTTADDVLAVLADLPFELASFRTIWETEWDALGAKPIGFSQGHAAHGWACAFRGAGHDRLVSRRWLDYGPWRVVRAPGDLTLVQFHDLAATPKQALEQATPGHLRMGIADTGGFIQAISSGYQVEGLYDPEQRLLEVVVSGRAVTQEEMLEACAVRWRKGSRDKPIERVAYVFAHDQEATAHVHELWLRELECWSVDGGNKHRLDLDYTPPAPRPPAWG